MNRTDYYLKELEPLIGATVEALARTGEKDPQDEAAGLVLVTKGGRRVVVLFMRDDEGNGPGAPFIMEQ